jgi:VPDSG-CTERM motif
MYLFKIVKFVLFATASTFAVSAFGDTFDYSYTFGSGDVVTGSFDGIVNGNLVNDLSNVSLNVNGVSIGGTMFVNSWDMVPFAWVAGGAVASFDGTQNNFWFVNSDWIDGDVSYTGYFLSLSALDAYSGDYSVANGFNNDNSLNSSWSLTRRSVPEGGATIALLGGALLGLAAFRRRSLA